LLPKPAQQIQDPEQGYLVIHALSLGGADWDEFLEGFAGQASVPIEKVVLQIKQKWIKLPPSETYTTELARALNNIGTPGQWKLHETYMPPEGSFGGASYRNELKAAAKEVGCVLPVTRVEAQTTTINIVAPSENK
jgi:hypothetical protein